jgi:hypothetical protein
MRWLGEGEIRLSQSDRGLYHSSRPELDGACHEFQKIDRGHDGLPDAAERVDE